MTGLVQFAAEHLGLELWPGQVDVLQRWEASGRKRAVLRLGRRSGKDLMAAVAAIKNAVVDDYSGALRPGEQRFILVVATREQQAREFVRVVRELLSGAPDPDLAALVDVGASTSDEVAFRTGVTLRAMPCSSRSTRGMAASLVIFNESAHMQTDSEGFAAFRSVWRALVPSTAQFGARGYVMTLSTPLWPSGWFHSLCTAGEIDPDLFHIHRATWTMNPSITRESLTAEFIADPDGAEREYGAEFVSGEGAFLDPVELHALKRQSGTLPPVEGNVYKGAVDPAFSRDAFALGIAHIDRDGPLVVDGVWAWNRAGFERTLDEVVEVAARYRVRTLRTDQFSSQAVVEGLQRRHMSCEAVPWNVENKWQAFSRLKALVRTRCIELPADDALLAELTHLEARPLPSGATRIAAAGAGHDDRAVVVAALCDDLDGHRGDLTVFDLSGGSVGGRDFRWVGGRMVFSDEADPETVEVGGEVLRYDDPEFNRKLERASLREFAMGIDPDDEED